MPAALDLADLLNLLDARETLLLPTARAAQLLRARFDDQQQARGLHAWEPAPARAWGEWLESLWSALTLEGHDDRVLLNRAQEEALWAEVIAAGGPRSYLPTGASRELARLARSGLQLAADHLALDRLLSAADTPDSRAFADWLDTFAKRCQAERLMSRSLLEQALNDHLRAGRIAPPAVLHLAGFEELTPAQRRLLQAFEISGSAVVVHNLRATQAPDQASSRVRASVMADSPLEELRDAVRWVRHRFERGWEAGETLALILPDPGAERGDLEPLLREWLAPELEPVSADLSSAPWECSAGLPLARLPIVQHALLLLRWITAELPIESVGTLLLSPFFASEDDPEALAQFEMQTLRRAPMARPELSLETLLRLARGNHGSSGTAGCPALLAWQAVRRLAGAPGELAGTGSHADWTELIRRVLRTAGWPGPRTLTPAEFRATEAWDGLLDLLATLDLCGRRVSYRELLDLLEREAAELSAPGSGAHPPVQILRLGEAEGCLFASALVLRATDEHLPAPEKAHPLLGWALQRSLGMPGTDAARTHARAQNALASLAERSGDLLLFAARENEHGPLRPTPLAAELGLQPISAVALLPPLPSLPPVKELLVPDAAPLPELPSLKIPGGARVLEMQAACGFRAFASLRLGAGVPEARRLGIDARESGNLLHRAMELFWSSMGSQSALRALPAEQQRAEVQKSVQQAFERLQTRMSGADSWTVAYLEVLQQRLTGLLCRWLDHELQRGAFQVLPPEQQQTASVGPLELSVRPDRIDQVDGGVVFVDYKTSFDLSPQDWLGERPDAPQLPLYALLAEADEIRGLAFARIRPGKDMGWLSLEDQPGVFAPKRGDALHDLAEEHSRWRAELDRLATAFADGRAEVDPKHPPGTCQFCEQRLLCRVDLRALMSGATPEVETPNG